MVDILEFAKANWLYILIGLAVAFFIYYFWKKTEQEQKSSIKTTIWKYKIPIILTGLFLYFFNIWGYVSDSWLGKWKSAVAFYLFGLFLWVNVKLFLSHERYSSTQAVSDNRHGSCSQYQEIGDYIAMNIGSCDATAFPWFYGHETWVVRKENFNKVGNQIFTHTQLIKSDIMEIPAQVHDFVESTTGYNKENIYYGEFSQETKLENVNAEELENKIKDTNRVLNETRTMLKGKTSSIKTFVSDANIIQKKAKGESLLGGIKESREDN